VVARMRAEVHDVLGDREPAPEDLQKLPYLKRVVDEILRMRSPVWALGRDVVADDDICGYRVNSGETVMPLPFLTHRHPAFWEDPERFDPDRFLPERSQGRHPCAYLPFSAGPRMCIGNLFTLVEAQVVLSMLLQKCDFELASLKEVPPKAFMTLRPAAPVNLRIRFRKKH
jgi:enediyne biosynthesis protein E7